MGDDALDFWLGRWDVRWPSGHGTNTIERILDGRVIEERFESYDDDGSVLLGRSLSVRDAADGRWRQTWADSTGTYLDLVGVDVDGRIGFQRTGPGGALQRMVWLDVTADGFRWEWQRSTDDGATWSVMWPLDYRRA
ncbi:MAG TPA: hypothetical protein VGJ28_09005 [Micromonosporaceae bacterium]|jgi:hypothetical protein